MKHHVMLHGQQEPFTFIRIPSSRGLSTRVEVRSVDPSANPYLAYGCSVKSRS